MIVKSKQIPVEAPSRILVVEDNAELNGLMQKTLRRLGYETSGVYTGAETIKWLAAHKHALIILDYMLPDMTGNELIEIITRERDDIPFVVITGHGDENIAVEMMKKGARDYIVKGPDFIDMLPHTPIKSSVPSPSKSPPETISPASAIFCTSSHGFGHLC